ncbi:hypothetical protein O181_076018 [Austropuccinia psidii MF-1]|uniref:Uncharacterized protein n=1 Tax=Austropuccinia psidii MF-1 TaxID=1389203 RepID=A0A9Q3ICE5_9BASI|nr:hypothetical protein [Austropuccinia psidii MF-1]
MNQQSTSDLPPLPEDTVEGQYAEESEEEDQTVQIQSLMKQMQDLLLTQSKKKGKRREQTSYTPGASPSEPTLPRHVRPEDSPISPTPGPRATSTPATEPRTQNIPRRVFVTTPNNPSPLQQKVPRQERPVVKIKAKDYNLNFDGGENFSKEDWTTEAKAGGELKGMGKLARSKEVEELVAPGSSKEIAN